MGNSVTRPGYPVCCLILMAFTGCCAGGQSQRPAKAQILDIPRSQIEEIVSSIQRTLITPSSKCRLKSPADADLLVDLKRAGPEDIQGYLPYDFSTGKPSIQIIVKGRNWPEESVVLLVDLFHNSCRAFDVERGIRPESADFPHN